MDIQIIEATTPNYNWGKFAVGLFEDHEWARPAVEPSARELSLIEGRGWTRHRHAWVMDLATGEGAIFPLGGLAAHDLTKHMIWVCPLFLPFLEWLYRHYRADPETWFSTLPELVDLGPNTPLQLHGYRRPGPKSRHLAYAIHPATGLLTEIGFRCDVALRRLGILWRTARGTSRPEDDVL